MIQLSVIIVNYNVSYFLDQAIQSVLRAGANLSMEVIVVDNASADNSVALVREKFPNVVLVANEKNVGFSVANNQGIEIAKGEHILLLNPDTVVQEDTFEACLNFMQEHPKAGGLGVKMIDGKGNFLPESKRGLPTPKVAFFKAFGLSSLFPKSKVFGQYHLGFLDKESNHPVDVLSGAFMFIRKEVLDKIGGLDEDFFMYGEDIDLSYRISKAGYQNYYIADTEIIHYKGESTKKGSLNYVKVFYEAMLIFAKKHFSEKQAKLYSVAIYFAIFVKGLFTLISNLLKKVWLPLLDIALSFIGLFTITSFWGEKIKTSIVTYPNEFIYGVIPAYIVIWVVSSYFLGVYDKPYRIKNSLIGVAWGTLIISAVYGFLPEELRFSRAIILMGAVWTVIAILINRLFYHTLFGKQFRFELSNNKNVIIVGNDQEAVRALNLLTQTALKANFVGFVSFGKNIEKDNYLGEFNHLNTIASLYNVKEVIFCAENVPTSAVIQKMTILGNNLSYKILPSKSSSIIGSNSKNTAGDLYAIDVDLKLNSSRAKRNKRIFDIISSMLLFLLSPLTIWFVENKLGYLNNCLAVFLGSKTWVGYLLSNENKQYQLPKLKPGVLFPAMGDHKIQKGLTGNRLNLLYAKDFTIELDLSYLTKNFKYSGNQLN